MSNNKMYKNVIVSAFALLMPLDISAQDMSGWCAPTIAELADETGWRKENTAFYSTAKADFDGDGKQDEVSLLIIDKQNEMVLFVELGSQPGKKNKAR
jgi:hypothetical protein